MKFCKIFNSICECLLQNFAKIVQNKIKKFQNTKVIFGKKFCEKNHIQNFVSTLVETKTDFSFWQKANIK
jgi:hypothetical protein